MRIESIEQEYLVNQSNDVVKNEAIVMTQLIIGQVSSPCILSRLMIAALGRPGVDNDMQFMHSGDRCIIVWTQPQLSLEATQTLISQAIEPPASSGGAV